MNDWVDDPRMNQGSRIRAGRLNLAELYGLRRADPDAAPIGEPDEAVGGVLQPKQTKRQQNRRYKATAYRKENAMTEQPSLNEAPNEPAVPHEVTLDEIREQLAGLADRDFGHDYPAAVPSGDLMQSRHMLHEIEVLAADMRKRAERRIVAEWCSDTAGTEVVGMADGHRFKATAHFRPNSQKWSPSTDVLRTLVTQDLTAEFDAGSHSGAVEPFAERLEATLAECLPLRVSWRSTALKAHGLNVDDYRTKEAGGSWSLAVERIQEETA